MGDCLSLFDCLQFTRVSSDIALVPVLQCDTLATIRSLFDEAVRGFSEFHHPPVDSDIKYPYVPGSYGAFRNPSNFHCHFARVMRSGVHGPAKNAVGEEGKYFAQLFDSMSLRYTGSEFKGESWHRDSNPMAGVIYGGWVNLDDTPQYFRCVPDSATKTGMGFASEQQPSIDIQRTIEIPPGNMILFRQDILHCILKSKNAYDSYRFYVGFRISDTPDSIYDTNAIIDNQSTPPLPSGETPAMFSQNHNSCLLYSHTIPWSECIVKDWIKEVRNVGEDGVEFFLCPRHVSHGLTHYGFGYTQYTDEEKSIMMPTIV